MHDFHKHFSRDNHRLSCDQIENNSSIVCNRIDNTYKNVHHRRNTRDPTPFVDREHGRISFVEEDPIGEMFD